MNLDTLWPYALALVLLLAVVIVVLLVLVLRKSHAVTQFSDAAEEEEETPEQPREKADTHGMIVAAFGRARALLRRRPERVYRTPLHLLIGAEGSREPNFLSRLGASDLQLVTEDPVSEGLAFGNGCGFSMFEDGVVIDLAGRQVLGADGVSVDERGWKTILAQLQELRPKRPADGVIVTISCAELLEGAKADAKLGARARVLHRRLAEAQRALGFQLPVYVLVTGCEQLKGFDDFCGALPESMRAQLLGWSSPHPVATAYEPSWVDEAFDDIHRDLGRTQMELFARGRRAGGVMQFPWSLAELKKPLLTVLGLLFRASAYDETSIVRGFYFCGTYEGETAFAGDLLEQKIFPETGLALPTARTRMARDRKVRTLKFATAAAAILFAAGLAWAAYGFREKNEILEGIFKDALLAEADAADVTKRDDEIRMATKILDGMAKIDFRRYGSIFVASSWFSPFEGELRKALSMTFSKVILDSIEARLDEKIETAIAEASTKVVPIDEPRRTHVPPLQVVDQTAEFRALQQFVSRVQQVEMHGALLNKLAEQGHGELRALAELVEFAFGHALSKGFYENGGFYETALVDAKATRGFDPEEHRSGAAESAQRLASDLYHRIYGQNAFAMRLAALQSALTTRGYGRAPSTDELRQLSHTMRELETDLAGPELQWAFRPKFDLGTQYESVLKAMQHSQVFGPDTVRLIRDTGSSGWADFNVKLAAAAPVTGPILSVRDGRPEMKLSTDTLVLQSAIDSFVNQGFAAARPSEPIATTLPANHRLLWNSRLLQQAVYAHQAYERFRDKGLKLFAPDLQMAVDLAARERVAAQMQTLLREAQTIEPAPTTPTVPLIEQELQDGIDRFVAASKLVDQSAAIFAGLDAHRPRADLAAIMTAEGVRLLRMNDELLARQSPYTPASEYQWRDVDAAPSPAVWGAKDAAELTLYLDTTRARLSRLARSYAKPVLAWLVNAGTDDLPEHAEIIGRWQSILDDVEAYDAKKPGNTIAALESSISGPLAKVTLKKCSEGAAPRTPSPGYLDAKLANLTRHVVSRCWDEAQQRAIERYRKMAAFFNDSLADRYPFATMSPASIEREADPESIRRFYTTHFDQTDALVQSIPANPDGSDPLQDARRFLDAMREVRALFAGFLDPKKAQRSPQIDIEPHFRTLQQRELGGNEIIRWTLTVGSTTLTERDKTKKVRWSPDQPVRLTLKWANDAPNVPVATTGMRGMTVESSTVTYLYTNRWSLFSALTALRAAPDELGAGIEAPPVTLAFVVDTKPRLAEGDAPSRAAQVFMRMSLLTPEGEPVVLPNFPSKAPALESLRMGEMR